ncbi:cytochrome c551/c552 [Rhizobium soli]|uniref:Cytochrome c551/c552 n=1 Tax=Rhizobium soli TaxID=424798 RepID=A0A7X0JNL7_9HYPH|nr:hypothetical protein [Rhizobium soli]MBB6510940.1 cytochrome c551/c552 [Rhizobium soli]
MTEYRYELVNNDGLAIIEQSAAGEACEFVDREIVGYPSESEVALKFSVCSSADSNISMHGCYDGNADYDVTAIRDRMQRYLNDHHSKAISVDFRDSKAVSNTIESLQSA